MKSTVFLWLLCGVAARELSRNTLPKDQTPQQPADVQQEKQSFHEPLTWKFPDPPAEQQPQYPPDFQLRPPTAVETISAACGEQSVRVEVMKDLLGIGQPVHPADISLGGCPVTEEDANTLVFVSELNGCGSKIMMTQDTIIYIFTLIYNPSPLGNSPIVRTRAVSVSIECHYQRTHRVSSGLMMPTWTPFSAMKSTEENLYFSITLMTDDWLYPRPSSQFLLGDMMNFEVSVKQFHHLALQVFVDSCVATVVPNIDTVPRYLFMGNEGCLFDSQLTGSSSRFLPRTQSDRLQFEVEAFKFQQDHSGVMYITCSVKATAATAAIDATNKACSFSNRWLEASGNHQACSCCNANCGTGGQSQLTGASPVWEQETAVGPIIVKDKPLP